MKTRRKRDPEWGPEHLPTTLKTPDGDPMKTLNTPDEDPMMTLRALDGDPMMTLKTPDEDPRDP